MPQNQRTGTTVTVHGDTYRITSTRLITEGRFFGRRMFELVRLNDDSRWSYLGKRVAHNSRLTPTAN